MPMSSLLTSSQNVISASMSASGSALPVTESGCARRYATSAVCPTPSGRASSRKTWLAITLIAMFGKSQMKRAASASCPSTNVTGGRPAQPPSSVFGAIGHVQNPTYLPVPCQR